MHTYTNCLNCMIAQGDRVAAMVTNDMELRKRINLALKDYISKLTEKDMGHSPAELSTPVYFILQDMTGIKDPFKNHKHLQNINALKLYDDMMDYVNKSSDPLHAASKVATVGNFIDCGFSTERIALEAELEHALNEPFSVDDFEDFRKRIQKAKTLLLLSDNAGEIIFDRCLLETIAELYPSIKIKVSVKSGPILNDVTLDDIKDLGIEKYAEIVTTGSDYIGAPPKYVSAEFMDLMKNTDVIISKGQGNYETLEQAPSYFYFALKAKCDVIARHLGVEKDQIVFKKGTGESDYFD